MTHGKYNALTPNELRDVFNGAVVLMPMRPQPAPTTGEPVPAPQPR